MQSKMAKKRDKKTEIDLTGRPLWLLTKIKNKTRFDEKDLSDEIFNIFYFNVVLSK